LTSFKILSEKERTALNPRSTCVWVAANAEPGDRTVYFRASALSIQAGAALLRAVHLFSPALAEKLRKLPSGGDAASDDGDDDDAPPVESPPVDKLAQLMKAPIAEVTEELLTGGCVARHVR
jgi:hypothetical protein